MAKKKSRNRSNERAERKTQAKPPEITVVPIDREEAAIRAELKRITPPNVELLKLADRFPAPQEWYDE